MQTCHCVNRYEMPCDSMQIFPQSRISLFFKTRVRKKGRFVLFLDTFRAQLSRRKFRRKYEARRTKWQTFFLHGDGTSRWHVSRWKRKSVATSATDCYICRSHNARYRAYIIRCIMHGNVCGRAILRRKWCRGKWESCGCCTTSFPSYEVTQLLPR